MSARLLAHRHVFALAAVAGGLALAGHVALALVGAAGLASAAAAGKLPLAIGLAAAAAMVAGADRVPFASRRFSRGGQSEFRPGHACRNDRGVPRASASVTVRVVGRTQG